jgi:UrcA family protein
MKRANAFARQSIYIDAYDIFTLKGASMNSMLSKRTALVGFAVLVSGAAVAQEPTTNVTVTAPSITIKYSDLNLATPSAVEVLYRRVEVAAKEVCNHGETRELARQILAEKCVNEAMTNAIQKIDVPQLNALYRTKSNRKVG